MAVEIDRGLCLGCGACIDVCPGDLLALAEGKSSLRAAGQCWTCLSCAKVCPQRAIRGRLPFVLADAGASLWPEPGAEGLGWVCEHPDGVREEFSGRGGKRNEPSSPRGQPDLPPS